MSSLFLVVLAVVKAGAAPAPGLAVAGALPNTGALTVNELAGLAPVTLDWPERDGVHKMRAVPLQRILTRFGFAPHRMGDGQGSGWTRVVRAIGADGFEAVFSCAELVDVMGATRAYVAFEGDGKPLPEAAGPLRLLVPTDKEHSRAVRQLVRLEVVSLKSGK